jgi:hypothetical protein
MSSAAVVDEDCASTLRFLTLRQRLLQSVMDQVQPPQLMHISAVVAGLMSAQCAACAMPVAQVLRCMLCNALTPTHGLTREGFVPRCRSKGRLCSSGALP